MTTIYQAPVTGWELRSAIAKHWDCISAATILAKFFRELSGDACGGHVSRAIDGFA
jgi:hypothetical protein